MPEQDEIPEPGYLDVALRTLTELRQLKATFEAGTIARIELITLALKINPAALKGRDPAVITDANLGEIIMAALPAYIEGNAEPCGKAVTCKRCNHIIGYIVGNHEAGQIVNDFRSVAVDWRGGNDGRAYGHCCYCHAKIYHSN